MAPSSGSQSNIPGSIPTLLSRLLFKVLNAVPDIMNQVQLFQERILTDAEQLALATGAAAYRWEDLTKAPVSPSLLLNPRRYGDGAKDLFITLNCVQENIIRGGQRDRSRRRPDGSRMPKSRAIKGIDEDMKLNKALWEMAEVLRNGRAQ
jgi:Domain of unknown function (DUF932)